MTHEICLLLFRTRSCVCVYTQKTEEVLLFALEDGEKKVVCIARGNLCRHFVCFEYRKKGHLCSTYSNIKSLLRVLIVEVIYFVTKYLHRQTAAVAFLHDSYLLRPAVGSLIMYACLWSLCYELTRDSSSLVLRHPLKAAACKRKKFLS